MQRCSAHLRHAARRCFATTSLYIDGAVSAASDHQTVKTHSPADGSLLAELSDASAADAGRAVAAAARCHAEGAYFRDGAARKYALERAAHSLRNETAAYATLEARDCGKTLKEAAGDVAYCADMLDYYAGLTLEGGLAHAEQRAPPPEAYELDASCKISTYPIGVACLITPWNYPLVQAVLKLAPAVAAGCPLVLKPSPLASLTCVDFIQHILGPLLRPGACNLLTGGPPLSEDRGAAALLADPHVAVCSFTGSSTGGEAVLNAGAPFARPSALELGGKGALIILDDADVEAASDHALTGILACAGQVCSATSRLLIQRPLYDAVIERVVAKMATVQVGAPLDATTTMGPLVSRTQQERVLGFIDRARRASLDVRQPAAPASGAGYFVGPTLVTGELEGTEIWREEVFGPVLCALPFERDQDAVALANASPFGLAHAVFSADETRAATCADALDAGVVWVNANQLLWPDTPFGGWKASGFGKEHGAEGMAPFVRRKTVVVAPAPCSSGEGAYVPVW